jgi:hypothetical protein
MPAYEGGDFVPPAPIARAVVRGPSGRTRSDVRLLLDTGADVSIVPRGVAEEVAAEIRPSEVAIRSYDGSESTCDLAELSIEFLRFRFRGVFLVSEAEYGVLGRNILNLLFLTLNGPHQT